MHNVTTVPANVTSAIIRIEPCSYGTKVIFADKAAMDSYVQHVSGAAERRIPCGGGYLEGEVAEQAIAYNGRPVTEHVMVDDGQGSYDWDEIPVIVTYPWLRLIPSKS